MVSFIKLLIESAIQVLSESSHHQPNYELPQCYHCNGANLHPFDINIWIINRKDDIFHNEKVQHNQRSTSGQLVEWIRLQEASQLTIPSIKVDKYILWVLSHHKFVRTRFPLHRLTPAQVLILSSERVLYSTCCNVKFKYLVEACSKALNVYLYIMCYRHWWCTLQDAWHAPSVNGWSVVSWLFGRVHGSNSVIPPPKQHP